MGKGPSPDDTVIARKHAAWLFHKTPYDRLFLSNSSAGYQDGLCEKNAKKV